MGYEFSTEGEHVTLPDLYQRLVKFSHFQSYLVHPESLKLLSLNPAGSVVYPGSWNPLHEGHLAIYQGAQLELFQNLGSNMDPTAGLLPREVPSVIWELSLTRRGKDFLHLEDVARRLQQFSQPVLLTNTPYFWQKAMVIPGRVSFQIGVDTALRLLGDHTIEELEDYKNLGADFVVWDRDDLTWDLLGVIPNNFRKATVPLPAGVRGISSTQLREQGRGLA